MAQTIKVLDLLNLKNWDQCTSSYIKSPLSIQEPVSINSNNLNGTQIEIFLIQSAITNFIFPWPNALRLKHHQLSTLVIPKLE